MKAGLRHRNADHLERMRFGLGAAGQRQFHGSLLARQQAHGARLHEARVFGAVAGFGLDFEHCDSELFEAACEILAAFGVHTVEAVVTAPNENMYGKDMRYESTITA